MLAFTNCTTALRAFILQRPRFDSANYAGAPDAYREDYRKCLADRTDALALLAHVSRAADTARMTQCLADALRSSRIEWNAETSELDYCTGQYFPTEYRASACRLLAGALWMYWRDAHSTGDSLRMTARNLLGKRLARRWFR